MDHGPISDINQPIFSYFPNYDSLKTPEKDMIELVDILKMASGFEWDEYPKEMHETNNWFEYILGRPIITKPGSKFHYNSGYSILLAGIIKKVENVNADYFAEQVLFAPLDITDYKWQTHKNGSPQTGGDSLLNHVIWPK